MNIRNGIEQTDDIKSSTINKKIEYELSDKDINSSTINKKIEYELSDDYKDEIQIEYQLNKDSIPILISKLTNKELSVILYYISDYNICPAKEKEDKNSIVESIVSKLNEFKNKYQTQDLISTVNKIKKIEKTDTLLEQSLEDTKQEIIQKKNLIEENKRDSVQNDINNIKNDTISKQSSIIDKEENLNTQNKDIINNVKLNTTTRAIETKNNIPKTATKIEPAKIR